MERSPAFGGRYESYDARFNYHARDCVCAFPTSSLRCARGRAHEFHMVQMSPRVATAEAFTNL